MSLGIGMNFLLFFISPMPDRIRDYKTAGCNMQQPPECSDDSRKI